MSMVKEEEFDEWQLALKAQIKILQECQQNHQITSCMQCSELLNCPTRDNYVQAVYDSMSKGTGGGFEF
jgi:hypothetical protein